MYVTSINQRANTHSDLLSVAYLSSAGDWPTRFARFKGVDRIPAKTKDDSLHQYQDHLCLWNRKNGLQHVDERSYE
jgi:hypothetical protein